MAIYYEYMLNAFDMVVLSYLLGTGLIIVAIAGIVSALQSPKPGRIYNASIYDDGPNYGQ